MTYRLIWTPALLMTTTFRGKEYYVVNYGEVATSSSDGGEGGGSIFNFHLFRICSDGSGSIYCSSCCCSMTIVIKE